MAINLSHDLGYGVLLKVNLMKVGDNIGVLFLRENAKKSSYDSNLLHLDDVKVIEFLFGAYKLQFLNPICVEQLHR